MKAIGWALLRILIVVAVCLATLLPDYGLLWIGFREFGQHPYLVSGCGLAWIIVVCLILPLHRTQFQWASTLSVIGVMAVVILQMRENYPTITSALWIFLLIVGGGIALGWIRISTSLWRWSQGVVAVEDSGAEHN